MKLVESGDFQDVIRDQKKVYPLIQYYVNKSGKKFFIIATLHSLFACKYYKKKSFESFLKNYDLKLHVKSIKMRVYKKNSNLMKINLNTTALELEQ